MVRTAALLCIHNEANRLGWWIAHHVAAGFSALLICDDHSTDGSQDILTQAARNYDIRLLATDQQETDRLQRHHNAQLRMIQQEGRHFDWIIQLAVDEYFLPGSRSVNGFFTGMAARMGPESFQRATHVPVNWCLTGLGRWTHQHFDGQMAHPRALFLTHAPETFPDSRVTRVFFRPSARQGLPDPFAHIQSPPDWSSGRILHDAAASSQTPQARRYYDRNDQRFDKGQALLPQTLDISAHILQGLIVGACYAIQNGQAPAPISAAPLTETAHHFRRFHLYRQDRKMALNREAGTLGFYSAREMETDGNLIPLCLVRPDDPFPEMKTRAWLHTEQPSGRPYLPAGAPASTYFPTLLDCLPIRVQEQEDGTVKLVLLPTGLPLPDGNPLTLAPAETPLIFRPDTMEEALRHFTVHGLTAAGLHEAIRKSRWISPSVVGALYAQLPAEEASTLFTPLLHRLFHDWKH
ncbi:glycosyltransferase family 2 protein [Bombella mellum]|uniref:Glycosyltransferase 2-like domain-containing protein n=1 Tax=Bombella mellum TaxID=2039288 RepID=A0ABR5ZVE0_9PROT|nr:glycosyltransferase family 2 protein [Bombella mellum]MBA5728154.1 hypothetical protein [Bombella mellum]